MAKPLQQEAYNEKQIYELEKNQNLIITRKRDGYKLLAVKSNGVWKIYTDGINEVFCLDHIKKELSLLKLPNKTILVGEGVVDIQNQDDFTKVASIFKSKPDKSLKIQEKIGFAKYMIFGIVFLNGKCCISNAYKNQLEMIKQMLKDKKLQHIISVPVLNTSFDKAKEKVTKMGWEGLVLYAKDFSSSYRLDAKNPARPKGCYKWKPIYEDDFIVRECILHPKDSEKIKEVMLSQINPETQQEFPCGKFGLFSTETRKSLKQARLPLVIQLKFEARFKSGKLRNARFMRFRTDKKPEQCVAPQSFTH